MLTLYIVLVPLLLSSAMFMTINMAQLTKGVSESDYGTVLALEMILASATRYVYRDCLVRVCVSAKCPRDACACVDAFFFFFFFLLSLCLLKTL